MTRHAQKKALIVGASRGLGLGLTQRLLERGWNVTATVRQSRSDGLNALTDRFPFLSVESVDINQPDRVASLHERLAECRFDLIFVVAGASHDRWQTVGDVSKATFEEVMVTNALSPMRFVERFQDLVTPDGTIAAMSSGQGSVANNTRVTGWEIYRASKAALNQLMRSFAARHVDDPRTLLLVAPGWVRTDMGGTEAGLSIEESTSGVADVVEQRAGSGGLHYIDYRGETIPW